MSRELLQQALDALETCTPGDYSTGHVIHPSYEERPVEDAITALRAALAQPEPWQGAEEWESLAWELCADENGEDACNELIWEGGPIKEPWGERWLKYEDEAKRLIALVRKHVAAPPAAPIDGFGGNLDEAFDRTASHCEGRYVSVPAPAVREPQDERIRWRDARIKVLENALTKIDAIRNDIIGRQKIGWSSHVYPLVAALGEAGYPGMDYEAARAALGDKTC